MLKYPFGMTFALLIYLLIFSVALMPFTFRLIFKMEEVIEIVPRLYPLNVAASSVVMAFMYHSFTRHNAVPKEMILWGKENRIVILIVAAFYLASFLLPSEVKFLPPLPDLPSYMHDLLQRLILWGLGWPIAITYGAIYEKVHGIKWASR